MTAVRLWWQGARPRTLGASIVPVIVGTAAAGDATWPRTLGCLAVSVGMQVGVNYANDYSDGRKGVDTAARVGPVRLTASGLASPRAVATAAGFSFFVAGSAGLALAVVVSWWLLVVGAASIAAAVLYSGGPRPYASRGLGEVFVFAFFGLVAVCGTAFVQAEHIRAEAWWSAIPVGLFAVAILIANNLRDIPTDTASGKRTLAVRLGDARTRRLYIAVVAVALALPLAGWLAGGLPVGAPLALAAAPLAVGPLRLVRTARGPELVKVLLGTALLQVQFGLFLAIGLALS